MIGKDGDVPGLFEQGSRDLKAKLSLFELNGCLDLYRDVRLVEDAVREYNRLVTESGKPALTLYQGRELSGVRVGQAQLFFKKMEIVGKIAANQITAELKILASAHKANTHPIHPSAYVEVATADLSDYWFEFTEKDIKSWLAENFGASGAGVE